MNTLAQMSTLEKMRKVADDLSMFKEGSLFEVIDVMREGADLLEEVHKVMVARGERLEELAILATPDQIVDERQRLDRLEQIIFQYVDPFSVSNADQPIIDEIAARLASPSEGNKMQNPMEDGNGPYRYQQEIDRLNGTVRPPSEGNKKGERTRDIDPDGLREDDGVYPALPASRPQEQPRTATGELLRNLRWIADRLREEDWDNEYSDDVDEAIALLSISPAAAEGWQMVPIKLTDAMVNAVLPMYGAMIDGADWPFTINLWRALLAAAPPSPAAPEQLR